MKIQLHILFAFLLTQLMGVQALLAGPVSGFVIFDQDTQYLVDNGILTNIPPITGLFWELARVVSQNTICFNPQNPIIRRDDAFP